MEPIESAATASPLVPQPSGGRCVLTVFTLCCIATASRRARPVLPLSFWGNKAVRTEHRLLPPAVSPSLFHEIVFVRRTGIAHPVLFACSSGCSVSGQR